MSGRADDEILPDQVALMCRLLTFPAAATLPGSILVTVAMGPTISLAARSAWVAALTMLALARLLLGRAYLSRPRDAATARRWLRLLLGLTAVVGAVWSLGGTVLLPAGQPLRESLTAMCLVAALAAGFSALSAVQGAYAALAVPFLLPLAAWQIEAGGWPRQVLGAVYLVFLLVMVGAASRTARTTREQFRLARENAELAARLGAERDALDRANTELRFASDAKSRFLGHMSHELRTPLTVILGYSDLLLRDEAERRRAESLQRIKSAGGALLAIVNDLLEVASLEAGHLALHPTDFAPAELLEDVAALLRNHPEARDLDIGQTLGEDLPPRLRADRERLRQVLLNLGVNALRYTPQGRVALSMRAAPGDGSRLRVEVADTGIGIARDAHARLFEPFTTLGDPAARRGPGAGLGLAISRSIVERMGGRIGVDSEPGDGSTFWFEVPFERAEPPPPPVVRFGARVPEAFAGAVLIAEDVAETREFLARFLRETGCAPVVEVANGRELLDAARDRPFDLMLVDWRMPELDGLAAIAALRAAERAAGLTRTPIVVVTAGALPEDRARCLAAGADAVVEKPVDLDRLAAVLRRWLRSATTGGAAPTAAAGVRRAVLVADDHPGNRQLLKEMLEEEGFGRVEAVASGLEAVAAWEQGVYDVLLLDWQMPGLDGLGALRRIRALEQELGRPRTAVVIVTGRLSDSERAACFAAGADACVAKPYAPDELLDAAERALQAVGR